MNRYDIDHVRSTLAHVNAEIWTIVAVRGRWPTQAQRLIDMLNPIKELVDGYEAVMPLGRKPAIEDVLEAMGEELIAHAQRIREDKEKATACEEAKAHR